MAPPADEVTSIRAGRITFDHLPDDILSHILVHLSLSNLLSLQQLSKSLYRRILSIGIPLYLSRHPQHHLTLHPPISTWSPLVLVRHNQHINRSLSVELHRWHALQVGTTWSQPVIPTLNVLPDQLILGVGGKLVVHPLVPPPPRWEGEGAMDDYGTSGSGREPGEIWQDPQRGKAAGPPREYPVAKRGSSSEADIIGIVPLSDGQLAVAQYDGTLQRLRLPSPGEPQVVRSTAHFPHPKGSNIRTLSGDSKDDVLMTTTSTSLLSIFSGRSPWSEACTMPLLASAPRAWSSLCVTSNPSLPPSAILGLPDSISIHPLHPSGSPPSPSFAPSHVLRGPDLPLVSSAYGLALPPSPSVHHPSTLLSGWYDSHLRLHDLRSPSPTPVQVFWDPYTWADGSAMYSTAFLGEHHIAGGGARHGTVSLFDTRYPKLGWSIFSPGGKGSPVYALQGEGGRLWGVSERRAFVLAFDGSGEDEGVVLHSARARRGKVVDRPSGWKARGGKWGWTVRYPEIREGRYGDVPPGRQGGASGQRERSAGDVAKVEGESTVGYEHRERTIRLFDSLVVP